MDAQCELLRAYESATTPKEKTFFYNGELFFSSWTTQTIGYQGCKNKASYFFRGKQSHQQNGFMVCDECYKIICEESIYLEFELYEAIKL